MIADITWSGVAERLIATGIIAAITAFVTLAVLRYQTRDLARAVEQLFKTAQAHEKQLAEMNNERTKLELRTTKTFSTRAEYSHLLVQQASNHRELVGSIDDLGKSFRDSIGKVHKRVDGLADRTSRLEGPVKAKT